MLDTNDLPYELQRYIAKKHSECSEANAADYRPTYQAELDDITTNCVDCWNRGQALIEEMAEAEHEQCRALFKLEHGDLAEFRQEKLVTMWFERYEYLVPAYVTKLKAARFLQPFFAPADNPVPV